MPFHFNQPQLLLAHPMSCHQSFSHQSPIMNKYSLQEHLVKDQKLPLLSLDRRFIKIERDMIVHVTEDDVPLFLKALLPSDWRRDSNLQLEFLLYLKPGKKATKIKQHLPIVVLYALLNLAILTKSLHKVLIVVNY